VFRVFIAYVLLCSPVAFANFGFPLNLKEKSNIVEVANSQSDKMLRINLARSYARSGPRTLDDYFSSSRHHDNRCTITIDPKGIARCGNYELPQVRGGYMAADEHCAMHSEGIDCAQVDQKTDKLSLNSISVVGLSQFAYIEHRLFGLKDGQIFSFPTKELALEGQDYLKFAETGDALCAHSRKGVHCLGSGNITRLREAIDSTSEAMRYFFGARDRACLFDRLGLKCSMAKDSEGGLAIQSYPTSTRMRGYAATKDSYCYVDGGNILQCRIDFDEPYTPMATSDVKVDGANILLESGGYHEFCYADQSGIHCASDAKNFIWTKVSEYFPMAMDMYGGKLCALYEESVSCWDISGEDKITALSTDIPKTLRRPRSLAMAHKLACVVDDIGIKCWGDKAADFRLPILARVKSIALSDYRACILHGIDELSCWNYRDYSNKHDKIEHSTGINQVKLAGVSWCTQGPEGIDCNLPGTEHLRSKRFALVPYYVGADTVCIETDGGAQCYGRVIPVDIAVQQMVEVNDADIGNHIREVAKKSYKEKSVILQDLAALVDRSDDTLTKAFFLHLVEALMTGINSIKLEKEDLIELQFFRLKWLGLRNATTFDRLANIPIEKVNQFETLKLVVKALLISRTHMSTSAQTELEAWVKQCMRFLDQGQLSPDEFRLMMQELGANANLRQDLNEQKRLAAFAEMIRTLAKWSGSTQDAN
jgi:hypothetical protein